MRKIKIPSKYSNGISVIVAVLLSLLSVRVDFFNRALNYTTGYNCSPDVAGFCTGYGGPNNDVLIFIVTLVVLYVTPFILVFLTEKFENIKEWPFLETATIVLGIAAIGSNFLYYNPAIFTTTLLLSYILFVIAYYLIVKRLATVFIKKQWGGALLCLVGIAILVAVIYVANSIMVYVE